MHKEKRRHFHATTTSAKLNIYIGVVSRDLFIDKAHMALDIFRFAVFFPYMLPSPLCGIFVVYRFINWPQVYLYKVPTVCFLTRCLPKHHTTSSTSPVTKGAPEASLSPNNKQGNKNQEFHILKMKLSLWHWFTGFSNDTSLGKFSAIQVELRLALS